MSEELNNSIKEPEAKFDQSQECEQESDSKMLSIC